MNPLRKLRAYLSERYIGKHRGGQLLIKDPGYPFEIEKILYETIEIFQQSFTKTNITASGTCKLTAVSTRIGEMAMHRLGKYDRLTKNGMPWVDLIKVGDLIVEAFLQNKYIDIEYTHYDSKEKHKCYIVSWGENWNCIDDIPEERDENWLRGSVQEEIQLDTLKNPITGLPIIKNMSNEADFKRLKQMPFLKAGNKLSQTKWKINKRVLDAVLKLKPELDLSNKSKRTEYNITTRKAIKLANLDWFCQYIDYDYRGRIYYTESFINFQGSDYSRGIMLFHHGETLDEFGRVWLAIHLASSYNQSYSIDEIPEWCQGNYKDYLKEEKLKNISVDKMILADRVNWCLNNEDFIKDTADNNKIYLDAEKPISFLAAAIEWVNVNSDPNYKCHLPIPVDGSNNGWQHLGAISKDLNTGKLVGLIPVEIQADFYVQTAKELIKLMPEWFAERPNMKMKHIRKGISKRGSMTRAYSAGAGKIAENMYKDCKAEGYLKEFNITMEDCKKLATNLVKAIKTVCPGPLDTMKFLQKVAQKKLETVNHLRWWTPSGFPVRYVSPYLRQVKTRSILLGIKEGKNQHIKHSHFVPIIAKETGKVLADKRAYASGISPNYIHSMDASHMALVIYNWDKDFGAVHDSFSTHANDIYDLLDLTKETFIKMYNTDNFFNKIQETFNVTMPTEDIPEVGELNITEVYDSDYFFA